MKSFNTILKETRKREKLSQKALGEALGLGQTTIANYESGLRLPTHENLLAIADFFHMSVEDLLGHHRTLPTVEEDKKADFTIIQQQFQSLVMEEKEKEAIHLLDEAAGDSGHLIDFYEEVIRKTLYNTGDLWQDGTIDVAKEHYISNVAIKAITLLSIKRRLSSPPAKQRPKALCMSYSSEMHTIGLRIVEEYLDMLGYETMFIGSTATTHSVLDMIKTSGISLIAISVTMSSHLDGFRNFIEIIRKHTMENPVTIIAGGQGIAASGKDASALGVDGLAHDYTSLKELVRRHV